MDTNVIVSGVLYPGNESELLYRLIDGQFTNVTSNEMVAELRTVLERPKFGLTPDSIDPVIGIIRALSEHVDDATIRQVVREIKPSLPRKLDPGDLKVLVCSAAGRCQYLPTGDKELLELGSFLGCIILKPLDMVRIIDRYQVRHPLAQGQKPPEH